MGRREESRNCESRLVQWVQLEVPRGDAGVASVVLSSGGTSAGGCSGTRWGRILATALNTRPASTGEDLELRAPPQLPAPHSHCALAVPSMLRLGPLRAIVPAV